MPGPVECAVMAGLFGLLVGSFANVCIHRIPLRESIVRPPSRCPSCGHEIRPWENVPLLSYAFLRGRCAKCRVRISLRYPAVEAANGAAWALLAWRLGPTPHAVVLMLFVTALLVLSLIDLDHHLLHDVITLPGIVAGLLASLLPEPPTPWEAVLSAAGGFLAFYLVAATYRRVRGEEGLGMGDWKMVAMLGAFLGWQKMLLTIFLASFLGSIVALVLVVLRGRDGRYALPLGTFLGFAGILVVFVGDAAVHWYSGFFSP